MCVNSIIMYNEHISLQDKVNRPYSFNFQHQNTPHNFLTDLELEASDKVEYHGAGLLT